MNTQQVFRDEHLTGALLRGLRAVRKVDETVARLTEDGLLTEDEGLILSLEVNDAQRELAACAGQVVAARDTVVERSHDVAKSAAARFYGTLDDWEKGDIFLKARAAGFHSSVEFISHTIKND